MHNDMSKPTQENTMAVTELARIQRELKAPKGQFNSFGKYHYRSQEDILEGLKKCKGESSIALSDEIQMIGHRFYVKATATLIAADGTTVSVTAYAREAEDKKGMDAAQVTGSTSSYARKYALNGLFAIDDTKDDDAESTGEDTVEVIAKEVADKIRKELEELGADIEAFEKYMGSTIDEITSKTLPKAQAAIAAKRKKADAAPKKSAIEKLADMAEEADQ